MKKILVLVANGSEEIETVAIVDVLRRANWEVTLASIHSGTAVLCSRKVTLVADCTLESMPAPLDYDALILPGGGPGTQQFRDCRTVTALCQAFAAAGKWLGAICAAPVVLQDAGLLAGVCATCHPSMQAEFHPGSYTQSPVAVDGRIITSRGPGTTIEFALAFVEQLGSKEQAEGIRKALVLG